MDRPDRVEDRPWWAALIVLALILAAILLWTRHPRAAERVAPIVVHGRLTATEEESNQCAFVLTTEDSTVSVTAPDQYLCDWLSGSNGHAMAVSFQPE